MRTWRLGAVDPERNVVEGRETRPSSVVDPLSVKRRMGPESQSNLNV